MSGSVLPSASELHLAKRSLKADVRTKSSQAPTPAGKAVEMTPNQIASVVFDLAAIRFGEKDEALALTLGVSRSLVSRWRSPEHREVPSLAQVMTLGPEFQRLFVKELSKFHGFGRLALLDLVESLGELASAVGE
jgi:hypothetical protein